MKFFIFFKNYILIYSLFLICRIIIELINVFTFVNFRHLKKRNTLLCIESGEKGWQIIEYKELHKSAIEYLGKDKVVKFIVKKNSLYISQIYEFIKKNKPTHYIYDSRTGSQNFFIGFFESICISVLFQLFGIIPICTLTDVPVRRWRLQTSIVSAKRGIVLSLMSESSIKKLFPHKRFFGPMPMSLSIDTLNKINEIKNKTKKNIDILFSGSLYEPRKRIFEKIISNLKKYNFKILVAGKNLGIEKKNDDEYWADMLSSKIIITTSYQISNSEADDIGAPHLIYRYTEALACESVLFAQTTPSIEKFYIPNTHFISFDDAEKVTIQIIDMLNNPNKIDQISKQGFEKATQIVNSKLYWILIDNYLNRHSLL